MTQKAISDRKETGIRALEISIDSTPAGRKAQPRVSSFTALKVEYPDKEPYYVKQMSISLAGDPNGDFSVKGPEFKGKTAMTDAMTWAEAKVAALFQPLRERGEDVWPVVRPGESIEQIFVAAEAKAAADAAVDDEQDVEAPQP